LELGKTVLWRNNVERRLARNLDQAEAQAAAERPDVILVDGRLDEAASLVKGLRHHPVTRTVSIVAIGNDDLGSSDLELLQNGANAILHLPSNPEWDDRLYRLIHVPVRRSTRFNVHLQMDAWFGPEGATFPGQALNLSVNGMLFTVERVFRVGDDVHFAFQLPELPGIIEGSGTVTRLAGARQYGLELTHVKGDGRQRIRAFVEGG
jgi:DNA-binding response OmpR family regulator